MSNNKNVIERLVDARDNIREAINNKGGNANTHGFEDFANDIAAITSTENVIEEKDINFYDYDGTLLYSYTFAEYLELFDELHFPSLPAPIEFYDLCKWNASSTLIYYDASHETKRDVGVCYTESDPDPSKARFYLHVSDSSQLNPTFSFYCNDIVEVSINNDEPFEIADDYGMYDVIINLPQPESYPADYCVEMRSWDECILGGIDSPKTVINYGDIVEKVYLGLYYQNRQLNSAIGTFSNCVNLKNVVVAYDEDRNRSYSSFSAKETFKNCISLKSIVIDPSITSTGSSIFENCINLKKVILPRVNISGTTTELGTSAFANCNILDNTYFTENLVLSRDMFKKCFSIKKIKSKSKTISSSAFSDCVCLKEVVLSYKTTNSSNKGSIEAGAFNNCNTLKILDLSVNTSSNYLPSLQNVNALSGTPSNMVIYVANQTMLDAFKAATNWSAYADRFQIKPS